MTRAENLVNLLSQLFHLIRLAAAYVLVGRPAYARVCGACSSYNDSAARAVQDEFQVRFWKLRQSEYEAYTLQCSPAVVRQVLDTSHPASWQLV